MFGKRIPKYASIFTAELRAIHLAFMYIKISRYEKFIIFSDSKSVLEAMTNRRFNNPIVLRLVEFNKAAKQALNKQISKFYFFYRF